MAEEDTYPLPTRQSCFSFCLGPCCLKERCLLTHTYADTAQSLAPTKEGIVRLSVE